MEVVRDRPFSIMRFLATIIISGVKVPVIGPSINPNCTKYCSNN